MKNTFLWGLAIWLLSSSFAQAQGLAPDVGAGKKRAAACFACHNADGISKIPGTPHLAGQERSYLVSALQAYRDGQRQNATMNAMAKPLSDRDIANIAAYYSLQTRMGNGQNAAQTMELLERIRPVGGVVREAPPAAASQGDGNASTVAARSGEAVYQAACAACHASGVAGAPKLGDASAWSSRLAQGSNTLLQHALQGFKGMPAKGGCSTCADAEVKAAVDYLTAKSK